MNRFRLILANVMRNRVRNGLLVFCTATAFLIFGALGAFLQAFELKGQIDSADRLIVGNKVSIMQPIPVKHLDTVLKVDGVAGASPVRWSMVYIGEPRNAMPLTLVDAERYFPMFPSIRIEPAARAAFQQNRTGVLIGKAKAALLGVKPGDRLKLNTFSDVRSDGSRVWEFEVSGLYASALPAEEQGLVAHYAPFNDALAFGRDNASWLVVKTSDPARNQAVATSIDAQFANSAAETKTQDESTFGRQMMDQLGNLSLIVRLVVGASFLAILIIVGNTLFHSIRSRTRELGLLKALGFPTQDVLLLVGGEVAAITGAGALLGLLAAVAIVSAISAPLQSIVPGLAVTGSLLAAGFVLFVVLTALSGFAPTLLAYRLKVVEAFSKR